MTRDERRRRDQQIVRAYKRAGASLHTVARQFGLNHSRVYAILLRENVEMKTKNQPWRERYDHLRTRVAELDRKEVPPREIAAALKLSLAAVYGYLREQASSSRLDLVNLDVRDASDVVLESSRYCAGCGRRIRVGDNAKMINWGASASRWRIRFVHPTCWEAARVSP